MTAQAIQVRQDEFGLAEGCLVVRQEHRALMDLKTKLESLFIELWGDKCRISHAADGEWVMPKGGRLQFGILPDGNEGTRYVERVWQGQSFTYIVADEIGQYSSMAPLDRLMACLRSDEIPSRMDRSFNPAGLAHQALRQRYVKLDPWKIHDLERTVHVSGVGDQVIKERLCVCPSSYRDNPFLPEDYLARLVQASEGDDELFKAWTGVYPDNWDIARGAYFAAALENPAISRSWPAADTWQWIPWDPTDWRIQLSYDHGTAKPAACYVMAYSPGSVGPDGEFYPPDSVIVIDEWTHHRQGNLAVGLGLDVDAIAPHLVRLAEKWGISPQGVADDQIFAKDGRWTIGELFRKEGVRFVGHKKHGGAYRSRAPSCGQMRQMLSNAGQLETPGLFVNWARCPYLAETLPFLLHDPDKDGAYLKGPTDHGADAVRDGVGRPRYGIHEVKR